METPNTVAGQTTEAIMAKVSSKLPNLPTHQYNAIYSAVYEGLEESNAVPTSALSRSVFERAMRRRAF